MSLYSIHTIGEPFTESWGLRYNHIMVIYIQLTSKCSENMSCSAWASAGRFFDFAFARSLDSDSGAGESSSESDFIWEAKGSSSVRDSLWLLLLLLLLLDFPKWWVTLLLLELWFGGDCNSLDWKDRESLLSLSSVFSLCSDKIRPPRLSEGLKPTDPSDTFDSSSKAPRRCGKYEKMVNIHTSITSHKSIHFWSELLTRRSSSRSFLLFWIMASSSSSSSSILMSTSLFSFKIRSKEEEVSGIFENMPRNGYRNIWSKKIASYNNYVRRDGHLSLYIRWKVEASFWRGISTRWDSDSRWSL